MTERTFGVTLPVDGTLAYSNLAAQCPCFAVLDQQAPLLVQIIDCMSKLSGDCGAEAICETIQTNLQEMSEKSAEIKELIGPATAFAPASSENGNGNDQQFLKTAGDERHSFATPEITQDHNR